jgi:hypothetical protein
MNHGLGFSKKYSDQLSGSIKSGSFFILSDYPLSNRDPALLSSKGHPHLHIRCFFALMLHSHLFEIISDLRL